MIRKMYEGFLGDWELEPETSHYGQGEAPTSGGYSINEGGEGIEFIIYWQDHAGETYSFSFSGVPDGEKRPFAGDDLIDSMSVSAPSAEELTSRAYYQGRELMVAKRMLVDDGTVMEVIQSVLLPDGSMPANVARYRRKLHS